MAPQTGTAVLVVAVFVLPGFVTLLLRERTYVVRSDESAFERLLGALYCSSLIFGVLTLIGLAAGISTYDISRLWHGKASLAAYAALGALALALLPAGISELGRAWQQSKRLRPTFLEKTGINHGHTIPAGWEQLFSASPGTLEGRGLMLRVTQARRNLDSKRWASTQDTAAKAAGFVQQRATPRLASAHMSS